MAKRERSMKLTNHLRDCFVRAVSNDIPEPKAPTLQEVQDKLYENFDQKIKDVYDNIELRKFLATAWYCDGSGDNYWVVNAGQRVDELPIVVNHNEAVKRRSEAIQKVRGVAYGCTTLKALREALPDLAKYMVDEAKPLTPGLPVPAGIYDELKSLGLKS